MTQTPQQQLIDALATNPRQFVFILGAGVTLGALEGSPSSPQASWAGLIRHGLQTAVGDGRLQPDDAARIEALLESDVPGLWIAAAQQLCDALEAPEGGEFRRWLRGTVGAFSANIRDRSVLETLRDFERRGVTLATVNYDSVLENATGLRPVTWNQPSDMERVLRKEQRGIVHLHGHWEDPTSIVLGTRSYDEVVADPHARSTLEAMRMLRTLVFIGHGSGLADPNWGSFFAWTERVFGRSEIQHYRIVREAELPDLRRAQRSSQRISLVGYPGTYAGLGPFLAEVYTASKPAAPSGSGSSIGARTEGAGAEHTASTGPEMATRAGRTPRRAGGSPESGQGGSSVAEDVDYVLLLLNIGEHDHTFVTAQQVMRQANVPPVTTTIECERVLDVRQADARQWRELAKEVDGLLEKARQAASDAPRSVCFVVAGRAPLPVFLYLGYRSKRLDGRILFVNQYNGGQWDTVGPYGGASEFPASSGSKFSLDVPTTFTRGAGTMGLFIGCSSQYRCEEEDLRECSTDEGHALTALYTITTDRDHNRTPLRSQDFSALWECLHEAMASMNTHRRDHDRLALAFGGPAWVAFWLGRGLNANVMGDIDFAHYIKGRGYVRALVSQPWRSRWVAGFPNVLLLAAEPGNETRTRAAAVLAGIKEAVEREQGRQARQRIRDVGSTQVSQLLRDIDRERPDILHMAAHGNEDGSLALEDERGETMAVNAEALLAMLRSAGVRPSLVVVTACYSQVLAPALLQLADCVVSVTGKVPYQVVEPFVEEFYGALARGRSVNRAFEQAKAVARTKFDVGREHFNLASSDGIDPNAIVFWSDRTEM